MLSRTPGQERRTSTQEQGFIIAPSHGTMVPNDPRMILLEKKTMIVWMSGEIHQLACIFCGRNRPIGHSGFSLKAMVIDPSDYGIITIRSVGPGPGRGHKGERGEGLRTIDRLNIREALENPQFSEIAGQVKDRLITIIRSYMRAGIISLDDITG